MTILRPHWSDWREAEHLANINRCNLAKVGVEGSNPFARSSFSYEKQLFGFGNPSACLLTEQAIQDSVSIL
jgi:hypothetical protein